MSNFYRKEASLRRNFPTLVHLLVLKSPFENQLTNMISQTRPETLNWNTVWWYLQNVIFSAPKCAGGSPERFPRDPRSNGSIAMTLAPCMCPNMQSRWHRMTSIGTRPRAIFSNSLEFLTKQTLSKRDRLPPFAFIILYKPALQLWPYLFVPCTPILAPNFRMGFYHIKCRMFTGRRPH